MLLKISEATSTVQSECDRPTSFPHHRIQTYKHQQHPRHDPKLLDDCPSYTVSHVRRLTSKHKYLASNKLRWMSETAVLADMVANTTVDDIGTQFVSLKTTRHEKVRGVRVSFCKGRWYKA